MRRLDAMSAPVISGIFREAFLAAGIRLGPKDVDVNPSGTEQNHFLVTVVLPKDRWADYQPVVDAAREKAEKTIGVSVGASFDPPPDE
jgi:hypothetical protein